MRDESREERPEDYHPSRDCRNVDFAVGQADDRWIKQTPAIAAGSAQVSSGGGRKWPIGQQFSSSSHEEPGPAADSDKKWLRQTQGGAGLRKSVEFGVNFFVLNWFRLAPLIRPPLPLARGQMGLINRCNLSLLKTVVTLRRLELALSNENPPRTQFTLPIVVRLSSRSRKIVVERFATSFTSRNAFRYTARLFVSEKYT